MSFLLLLPFLLLVYGTFRILKIDFKMASISVTLLIGLLTVPTTTIMWQGSAPVSHQAFLTRNIVEMNSQLKGFVDRVNFEIGDEVKKGELVWGIDKTPYETALASAKARLEAARTQVNSAEAALKVASAGIQRADANAATAQTERDRAARLFAEGSSAISELQVEQLENASDAANAAVLEALASEEQARAGIEAAQRNVSVAEEAVRNAEFDLELTDWHAPYDGVLIAWFAREKQITTALRAAGLGTFMETSNTRIVVPLSQKLMRNVAVGDEVELAFFSRPGLIDTGKVIRVANYTGEGQFTASAAVPRAYTFGSQGVIAAVVALDDDELARTLSFGEAGAGAVFTQDAGPFALMSKIYLRIISLAYFLS